jgi:hypothetical protein
MTQQFYSTRLLNETEIIRALAVRPTDDLAIPPGTYARFRSSFESALVRGFDTSSCAIEALLQSLAVRENPAAFDTVKRRAVIPEDQRPAIQALSELYLHSGSTIISTLMIVN